MLAPSAEFPLLKRVRHIRPEILLTELLSTSRRVAILMMDREGTILLSNAFAARGYRHESAEAILGKNLRDVAHPEWAEERIGLARQCIETDKPVIVLQISGGFRIRFRMTPIRLQPEDEHPSCMLLAGEEVSALGYKRIVSELVEGETVVHSKYVDLGPLDVLSTRELEVLALMREGHRTKDIAKMVHRSVSTIENHRENIGHKLGLQDRSKIINLANIAVLQVEDATRTRINIPFIKHLSVD